MGEEEHLEDMTVEELQDIDKLEVNFTLRIPEVTKGQLERLPPGMKKKLNNRILLTMARTLHEADFDPRKYLKSA
ncbi:MAG: hypothetical protein GX577_15530 [Leptolinea sp.]|nr:hypothetical protein [Leptolinea sp.]